MIIKTLTNRGLKEEEVDSKNALSYIESKLKNGSWLYVDHTPVEKIDLNSEIIDRAEEILLTNEIIGGHDTSY